MNTYEELRDKAEEMELLGVSFLNRKGEIAQKPRVVVKAEFTFIDGTKLMVPKSEMDRPEFGALNFNLRPTEENA